MVARRRGIYLAGAALAAVPVAHALEGGAGAAPAPAPTAAAAAAVRRAPTAVGISAREYRFGVYRTRVRRGRVRFNLTNYGEDAHDLVVLDRRGRRVAASREVKAGERTTLRVRLAPGRYRLVCDLADHAARGMRTRFVVTRGGRR